MKSALLYNISIIVYPEGQLYSIMPAYAFAHMNVSAVETACMAGYRVDEDGIKVSRCIERWIIVVLIPGING